VLRDRAKAFASDIISIGAEALATLQWILVTEIPRRVKAAFDSAVRWTAAEITKAKNVLTAAINTLRTWIQHTIAVLDKFAHDVLNWAHDQVSRIQDYLNKTVKVWYDRLTDPRKFAVWVIAAITTAFLSYLYAQRDRISAWLLRSSPAFTVWLAKALEDVLRRLL
jgi:hypothetical protein